MTTPADYRGFAIDCMRLAEQEENAAPRTRLRVTVGSLLNDFKHWFDRARKARAIANDTDSPLIRRSMLRLAAQHEALAWKADEWPLKDIATAKNAR
jgi:hypothetical protein